MLNKFVPKKFLHKCPDYQGFSLIVVKPNENFVEPKRAANRLRKGLAMLIYAQQWIREVIGDRAVEIDSEQSVATSITSIIDILGDRDASWNVTAEKMRPIHVLLDLFGTAYDCLNTLQSHIKALAARPVHIAQDKTTGQMIRKDVMAIKLALNDILLVMEAMPRYKTIPAPLVPRRKPVLTNNDCSDETEAEEEATDAKFGILLSNASLQEVHDIRRQAEKCRYRTRRRSHLYSVRSEDMQEYNDDDDDVAPPDPWDKGRADPPESAVSASAPQLDLVALSRFSVAARMETIYQSFAPDRDLHDVDPRRSDRHGIVVSREYDIASMDTFNLEVIHGRVEEVDIVGATNKMAPITPHDIIEDYAYQADSEEEADEENEEEEGKDEDEDEDSSDQSSCHSDDSTDAEVLTAARVTVGSSVPCRQFQKATIFTRVRRSSFGNSTVDGTSNRKSQQPRLQLNPSATEPPPSDLEGSLRSPSPHCSSFFSGRSGHSSTQTSPSSVSEPFAESDSPSDRKRSTHHTAPMAGDGPESEEGETGVLYLDRQQAYSLADIARLQKHFGPRLEQIKIKASQTEMRSKSRMSAAIRHDGRAWRFCH